MDCVIDGDFVRLSLAELEAHRTAGDQPQISGAGTRIPSLVVETDKEIETFSVIRDAERLEFRDR